MNISIFRQHAICALLLFPVTSSGFDQPESLPANLATIVHDKTSGFNEEEKSILNEWTPAKELGEFFCQQIGLQELGKIYSGADRIFVDGIEQPPEFIAENRIAGFGSVRYQDGWKDFTYECAVDLKTGDALEFIFSANP